MISIVYMSHVSDIWAFSKKQA